MLKTCLAAALSLLATAVNARDVDHPRLSASGDGSAHIALLGTDGGMGPDGRRLTISATFLVDLPVQDSTEAHSKARWFTGEVLVDGKACSDTRGRLRADAGHAHAEARASCEVSVATKGSVKVEGVAAKAEGLEREDVHVELSVDTR